MSEDEAIKLLRMFCEGSITATDFESRYYGEDHDILRNLLSEHRTTWGRPIKSNPYDELLEIDIAGDPESARSILRAFLGSLPPEAPTDDDVRAVEQSLGYELPASLVEFIRSGTSQKVLSGRAPVREPIPKSVARYLSGSLCHFGPFWNISHDSSDSTGVLHGLELAREWDLPAGLVLLSGDGHTWVALDYRAPRLEPSVVFLVSASGESAKLADSFADLLKHASRRTPTSTKRSVFGEPTQGRVVLAFHPERSTRTALSVAESLLAEGVYRNHPGSRRWLAMSKRSPHLSV